MRYTGGAAMFEAHTGLTWRKRCSTGGCVEVAETGAAVLVRQSEDPEGPHLTISHEAWEEFLRAIRAGEFEPVPGDD
jgi:hypothetical protein